MIESEVVQIQSSLDHASLMRIAGEALKAQVDDVVVDKVTKLKDGAGNPTSAGLWRISGTARANAVVQPWSVVMKKFVNPEGTFGDHNDQTHVNYWRRELDVFESDIYGDLPDGTALPAYFGSLDEGPDSVSILIEDLGDLDRSTWTLDTYVTAARALALIERRYLTHVPLPRASWINSDIPRKWGAVMQRYVDVWRLPAVAGYEPLEQLLDTPANRVTRPWIRALYEPEPLFAALDRLPHVFGHNDPNIDNLAVRLGPGGAPEVVLFDLQWSGITNVGSELSQLLCQVPATFEGRSRAEVDELVLAAYYHELVATNADVTFAQAEFGYAASATLRELPFSFGMLGLALEPLLEARDDDAVRAAVSAHLWAIEGGALPRLVNRAYELAAL